MTNIDIEEIPAIAGGETVQTIFEDPDNQHNIAIANTTANTINVTAYTSGIASGPVPYTINSSEVRVIPDAYRVVATRQAIALRVVLAVSRDSIIAGLAAEIDKKGKASLG